MNLPRLNHNMRTEHGDREGNVRMRTRRRLRSNICQGFHGCVSFWDICANVAYGGFGGSKDTKDGNMLAWNQSLCAWVVEVIDVANTAV
jgi:hypothetical protein